MDQSDDMGTNKAESLALTPKKKPNQRVPKCTRCQNHGKKVEVKLHKRECEFRYCLCPMCILTTKRQQVMKEQTAQRRARQNYETLMRMRREKEAQAKEAKAKLEGASPAPPSINDSNDSNSSDMPILSNRSSSSEICKSAVTVPQGLRPLLPQTPSPAAAAALFEPEQNADQVETLMGYSASLIQWFGYPCDSLTLMYAFLKEIKADVKVAMSRIAKANSEIQATAQFRASRFGPQQYYYYPGYSGTLATLGNPTYFGQVPYVGMASPPTTADLARYPFSMGPHSMPAKVPSSPDSPPERPSSYSGGTSFPRIKQASIHS